MNLRGDITPQAYADFAQKWAASGAGMIGGCCGISPEHLKLIKGPSVRLTWYIGFG